MGAFGETDVESDARGTRASGSWRSARVSWMHRLRMRTMAWVVGLLLAGFTVASAFALPLLPVLGVAVAAAAVMVNQVASRLVQPTCYGCGRNIAGLKGGAYGVECPDCGSLTQVLPREGRAADHRHDAVG